MRLLSRVDGEDGQERSSSSKVKRVAKAENAFQMTSTMGRARGATSQRQVAYGGAQTQDVLHGGVDHPRPSVIADHGVGDVYGGAEQTVDIRALSLGQILRFLRASVTDGVDGENAPYGQNVKDEELKTEKLKILVGHTHLQVVCGAILGLLVALGYFWIFNT